MSMKYGIQPLSHVTEAFVWRWGHLYEAKEAARLLSEKHHVSVIVFEVIGTYSPVVHWEEFPK